MKLKALLLALCTAGFAVSIAVAASPAAVAEGKPSAGATTTEATSTGTTTGDHGKAKGHAKAKACKPARKLLLRGEFVAAGSGGFALAVQKGNHGAKAFAGKQVSVLVDDKTRFHGQKRKLADLAAGDRLVVQGFACKADAAAGSMLARKVGVRAAKPDAPKDDEQDETTTSGTTTGS
jgi:hypothetical protein